MPLVRHRARRGRHLPLLAVFPPAAASGDAQPHGHTSGRYEMDPVSNPTIGKSLGGGRDSGSGKIMVEGTVVIKFGSNESVDGLVQGRASTKADESGGRRKH